MFPGMFSCAPLGDDLNAWWVGNSVRYIHNGSLGKLAKFFASQTLRRSHCAPPAHTLHSKTACVAIDGTFDAQVWKRMKFQLVDGFPVHRGGASLMGVSPPECPRLDWETAMPSKFRHIVLCYNTCLHSWSR